MTLLAGSFIETVPGYVPLLTGSKSPDTNFGVLALGQNLAANTVLGRVAEVQSYLRTGVVGNNNAIEWRPVARGTSGNLPSIALVDPAGNNQALAVSVTGKDVSVSLATGVAGAITSTAAQVIAAVAANAAAAALVTGTNYSTSNGTAAVVAVAKTSLANGADGGELKALAPSATDGTQIPAGILVHAVNASTVAAYCQLYVGGTFNPDLLVFPASVQTDSQKSALFDGTPIHLRRPT
jgi:hypothetical protein